MSAATQTKIDSHYLDCNNVLWCSKAAEDFETSNSGWDETLLNLALLDGEGYECLYCHEYMEDQPETAHHVSIEGEWFCEGEATDTHTRLPLNWGPEDDGETCCSNCGEPVDA